ncbi:ABC-type multidrug transport system, ATpase and permease component [Clostridium aceticum]|uniref:ABC-type multidrug transport system, ATpase and permease component n=1 Tax=Clostridium aceticum TaxID=84022 RepID=A0A0D8I7V5_9CLOT|nr:ABC transporter ATP-binding protein [Clostridium aceticum]AKL94317.1 ABC-type multidrug transport system, ATpase and permease component [Clostridium aceticum]KJF26159.1 thiamine ABC transporter permease [Clostridium aceticum]
MLKKFIQYYKPHLPLFIMDFSCAFVMAGMDLVFPFVVGKMIDDVLPSRNLQTILWVGIGMLVLYVFRSILQYTVDYWGHVLGVRMEKDMRRDLFHHLHKLPFNYFDNTKTGHIMSRLVNDLNEISELAHHGPEDLFIATVTLVGSFFIMIFIHVPLTLITFSIIPIVLIFAISKNKTMQHAFRNMRLKLADINAQVEDSVAGVRVVKSFTNEVYEEEKFAIGNKNFKESKEVGYKVMAEFFAGVTFFANFIHLVVLIFGGIFIYQGSMTTGELIGFLLYVSMFLQPMRKLTILVENYQKGMAGFHRFYETLQLQPEIVDMPNAEDIDQVKGRITFKNVTFSYNNKASVLENISFTIQPGETVAIVGPSGGGKTTLCSLIPRFYEVDNGIIEIDDKNIQKVTQKSLRQNIGIVQQDVFLFSGTIKENIAYGKITATDEEIIAAAKKANAHEFIMNLENGYDTYIGERGVKLSGGQKQRLSIARIFLKNPPILILDEATSALDNETEKVIQASLHHLSENRTTLIIAHRLTTIREADRIMVLTEEGIVEEGDHENLLAQNGVYTKLYKAQFSELTPDVA